MNKQKTTPQLAGKRGVQEGTLGREQTNYNISPDPRHRHFENQQSDSKFRRAYDLIPATLIDLLEVRHD